MNRILFVVDEPQQLRNLRRLFPAPHFEAHGAADGVAALPLLELFDHDVLITDAGTEAMSGTELLARARARRPDTVRILLTDQMDFGHAVEVVNRGEVFRMLRKPCDEDELRFSVKLALSVRKMKRDREALQQRLVDKTRAMEQAHADLKQLNQNLEHIVHRRTTDLLDALSAALDMRDNETEAHSRRVSAFAGRLAREMGLDESEQRLVEQGALLHDVGKIGVCDAVLLKPGKLDEAEWEIMRRHPGIGYDLLRSAAGFLEDARQIILQHQERFDGQGYPSGLRGEEIVVGARIFAVVDTYDAITSDRPYRKAQAHEVAARIIEECSGTQLDPTAVEAFLRVPSDEWQSIRTRVDDRVVLEAA